jgi:hypothetical protein
VSALLESLTDVGGVPVGRVIIVVGETKQGAPELECRGVAESGAKVRFTPYANIDNNAFIWASGATGGDARALADLPEDAWVFYLHDTCAVTDGFWKKVVSRVEALENMTPVPLAGKMHRPYSMCIGWYSVAALRRPAIRADLARRANLDRSDGMRMKIKRNMWELEDHVFRMLESEFPGALWISDNQREVIARDAKPYETETERIYEFYADPGVVKKKANYGEGKDLHLEL